MHLISRNDNLTHLGWTLVDVLVIAGLGGGVPPPPPPVVNKGSAEPFSLAPLSKLFPPVFDGGLDESWLLDVANTSSCSEGECRQERLNWKASYYRLRLNQTFQKLLSSGKPSLQEDEIVEVLVSEICFEIFGLYLWSRTINNLEKYSCSNMLQEHYLTHYSRGMSALYFWSNVHLVQDQEHMVQVHMIMDHKLRLKSQKGYQKQQNLLCNKYDGILNAGIPLLVNCTPTYQCNLVTHTSHSFQLNTEIYQFTYITAHS